MNDVFLHSSAEDRIKDLTEKEEALKACGVEVVHTSEPGRVNLRELMQILGAKESTAFCWRAAEN